MPSSLEIIRQAHQSFKGWLETVRKLPDPSGHPPDVLNQIRLQLKIVDEALRQAPSSVVMTQEWREELAAYVETLREVRARLGNLEIMLRIRQAQAHTSQNRLSAVRSWSDLAKNIG